MKHKYYLALICLICLSCTPVKRIPCPVYVDTYKKHWMNEKFGTKILHQDTYKYMTSKTNKCKN